MSTGYNTNVPCGAVVLHVQTEQHGSAPPQIETLVFREGRIVGARRVRLEDPPNPGPADCTRVMEEQHRAVVAEVRAGRFAPDAAPRRYTIVAIDDDAKQLAILERLFEQSGHRSVSVSDPRTALDTARTTKPDFVLCDILMGDVDGYAVLRELQSDPVTAAIPVAFMTGLDADDERLKAYRFGVIEYFTKPFNPSLVVARVLKLIRERAHRACVAASEPTHALLSDLKRDARTGVLQYPGRRGPAIAWLRGGELVDGALPAATLPVGDLEFTELDLEREEILPDASMAPAGATVALPDFSVIPPQLRLVLLVEHDRVLRKKLRDALGECACRALEAEDREQGLRLARWARPSVVVTGTGLPGAFELRRTLRAAWDTTCLPLLFLPGSSAAHAPIPELLQHILRVLTRYADAWPPESGGISGRLEAIGVATLLRMCELAKRSGRLVVGLDDQRIEVRYSHGAIVGSDSGSATGLDALLELSSWRTGVFLFLSDAPLDQQQQPVIPLTEVLAAAAARWSQGQTAGRSEA